MIRMIMLTSKQYKICENSNL
uniref:Uncharacterized protein n=1 Tax=Rhizophora mucronata TaxID=61149 RepID=A0A2P2PV33_RHIMU